MLPVAILAGGLATRLHPLSDRTPKALLRVAGRPFLFHQLEQLQSQGVNRVVLCAGHLGAQIRQAAGNGRAFGLSIDYSFDGSTPLGTGGALRQALSLLGPDFFALYGDTYLTCSFARLESAYEAARPPALMAVLRNEDCWERSNVLFRDGELIAYDKHAAQGAHGSRRMSHIDLGVSVLSSAVFGQYDGPGALDLSDVFRDLSRTGSLAGLEFTERFHEIGSPQGLHETEAFLSRRACPA